MFSPDAASEFELVRVQSGAQSLRSRAFGETFHPVIGPVQEAETLHVRPQRLAARAAEMVEGPFVVWDVGLGAAANALAALEALRESPASVEVHSFERDLGALEFALWHGEELPYLAARAELVRELITHGQARLGSVSWRLHRGDFRELLRTVPLPAPRAILFDPYSPVSNPDLWSLEAFRELYGCLSPGVPCLLTNYTRSTAVRATMLLAGFHVGHGRAVAEKDQTTAASNDPALLEAPLGEAWLQRARRSTRSAPPRDGTPGSGPIGGEDWQALLRHPQFAALNSMPS
jgi:tRNA U34 5-methylaminomethyl-2-thiouridine-forming methyltransferase MnmC